MWIKRRGTNEIVKRTSDELLPWIEEVSSLLEGEGGLLKRKTRTADMNGVGDAQI